MHRFLIALLLALCTPAVTAADGLPAPARVWIESADVPAGTRDATVTIHMVNAANLTVFAFDLIYAPAGPLCTALDDSSRLTVRRVGRTLSDRWEETTHCASGKIRTVVGNLLGDVVIPAGDGPIFQLVLEGIAPHAHAEIRLALGNFVANAGPLPQPIANQNPVGSCSRTSDRCLLDSNCPFEGRCVNEGLATLRIGEAASVTSTTAPPAQPTPTTLPPAIDVPTIEIPAESPDLEALRGRLDGLLAAVAALRGRNRTLAVPLLRAGAHLQRATYLQAEGRDDGARSALRRTARDLRRFHRRLRARHIEASLRDTMIGLAEPLERDVRALSRATGGAS